MNRGNFLGQPNKDFPLDCETLDFMQANETLLSVLGQIGGDKAILSGCTTTGTTVAPGYVFLKTAQYPEGEVLHFDGGTIDAVNTTVYIAETAVAVTASGYTYPQAYYTRSLKAGLGSEQFLWSDFARVETNAALKARVKALEDEVAALAPLPIGIPQIWTGYVSKIPNGMVLYDGRALNIADYPKAYAVWGTMYNTANGKTTPAGQFRIPDLSAMFLVGYTPFDDDYKEVGTQGGAKTVALKNSELPEIDITIPGQTGGDNNDHSNNTRFAGGDKGSNESSFFFDMTVKTDGKGTAHENLPPFFTVAYIGRIE